MRKGSHHSEKSKGMLGEKARHRWESPQYRVSICKAFSEGHKGKPHLCSDERDRKISETLKRRYRTGEIAVPFKGKHHTEEAREKMSLNHADILGEENPNWGKHHTEETRKRLGEIIKMAWESGSFNEVDWNKLNSGENNPMYGKHHSEETRELIREKAKERFEDPRYREFITKAIMDGCRIKPNKPEQFLIKLIEEHNLPFRYVGDGQFILGGKCPDFLNCNGEKQLMELYGDYWHQNDDPQERISFFRQYGFDTLIIWEHELSNPITVASKIKSFEN